MVFVRARSRAPEGTRQACGERRSASMTRPLSARLRTGNGMLDATANEVEKVLIAGVSAWCSWQMAW